MTRGVRWSLASSLVLIALIALAGCSHYLLAEREPWRAEAELTCLNSGAVKESPTRVRIAAIDGPGACGANYPFRISTLGEGPPLGYTDEPPVPPSTIPNASMPQHWPVVQSSALPPPQTGTPQLQVQPLPPPQAAQPQTGAPMSLSPPGIPEPEEEDVDIPGGPPHPYYSGPNQPTNVTPVPAYPPHAAPAPLESETVPLGPPSAPILTNAVEVKPAATLACPIVSVLDQWIGSAVQPAALRWFRQPVVEIKQISSYSCRGMNGNPDAHISEHAFGNALDIAEFTLADGHKISVQYGWHGTPEEQGFLHDVQAAACQDFTTVLAPGANVYHYNHIHVDLMRRASGRHVCEPAAISGEVAAERARARYAAEHRGDPSITGSLGSKTRGGALSYSGEDNDRLPLAMPGSD